MIYDYACECGERFEVMKSMHDASRPENCKCGKVGKRLFSAPYLSGTKVFEAYYNHGLGQVIHNKRELNNVLAKKNLVEVGNDFGSGEKMQKHFDTVRKEAHEKSWDAALESIKL